MAEESEDTGAEAAAGVDPTAMAFALDGASREKADAFLDDQRALIADQRHHLREQFKQLRLGIWEKRLGVALRAATVVIGVVVAAALGFLVWDATQAQGLVIEAFSVPPDLVARGLTGEVVATRFLDQFKAMQVATVSERPADTYQYNWGTELKVEIPETGLTFGELDKFLRDHFGSATHVTGEVVRTATGIAVTARLGDAPPKTFAGSENDFDSLARQAAEAVYRGSQPYRYAQYVASQGRNTEAFAVISDLATNGPLGERSWAYTEWGMLDLNARGDLPAAIRHCQKTLTYRDASLVPADICLVNAQVWLGHDEIVLGLAPVLKKNTEMRVPGVTEDYFENNKIVAATWLEGLTGAFRQSAQDWRRLETAPDYEGSVKLSPALAATALALDHDPAAAAKVMSEVQPNDDREFLEQDADFAVTALPGFWTLADRADWTGALADARAADAWLAAHSKGFELYGRMRIVWIAPLQALAMAKSDDVAGGEKLISDTPTDCYLCLRIRGQIAALKGDAADADRWFSEAVRQAPSYPFAYAEWGESLLERRQPDAAIAKFTAANIKGPQFADPLEMWGEALMAKNRSDLALDKFTEAEKQAPNWGRLHLKWGEALMYAGHKNQARAQYRTAAKLELDAADRAELESHLRG